jgi:hypothetical protein
MPWAIAFGRVAANVPSPLMDLMDEDGNSNDQSHRIAWG